MAASRGRAGQPGQNWHRSPAEATGGSRPVVELQLGLAAWRRPGPGLRQVEVPAAPAALPGHGGAAALGLPERPRRGREPSLSLSCMRI